MKVCSECQKTKSVQDFYFTDGGLGFVNDQMGICKHCVQVRNRNPQSNNAEGRKYFDEQISATYYGAKAVINGQNLSAITNQIDNGIETGSNRMAIQNFLYLFGQDGGLPRFSRQMKRIFNALQSHNFNLPDEIIDDETLTEGAKKQITVNAYERNPQARAKCIEHHGLDCKVCGFNFAKVYGEIGEGYIHVHHIKPLSEIRENYEVDPINDLVPVCPNCHAMLHRRNPPYSVDELKNF